MSNLVLFQNKGGEVKKEERKGSEGERVGGNKWIRERRGRKRNKGGREGRREGRSEGGNKWKERKKGGGKEGETNQEDQGVQENI